MDLETLKITYFLQSFNTNLKKIVIKKKDLKRIFPKVFLKKQSPKWARGAST